MWIPRCAVLLLLSSVVVAQDDPPAAPPAAPPPNTAVIPAARDGGHRARHDKINEVVQAHRGACDLVFVGDSITQAWEGPGKEVWAERYGERRAVNLGISGDRTEHVLWRLENGNLDGITPKVAVVMIGTNNFGHGTHSSQQVLEGVRAVVASLREKSPTTSILLLGIFPRGQQFNEVRGNIVQVNQALARLDDGERVRFLDIGHVFVGDDGSIDGAVMPDFLHLTAEGYRLWADAIEGPLADLLGR